MECHLGGPTCGPPDRVDVGDVPVGAGARPGAIRPVRRSSSAENHRSRGIRAMTEKPAKPPAPAQHGTSVDEVAVVRKRATRRRKPSSAAIAERAYYIHLEEGCHDELGNWLRAERELTAA